MDRNRLTEDDQAAPRDGGDGMAPAERQVIVICEECGKKYSVVLSRIRGSAAGFTCRSCGHRIVVAKPPEALPVGPTPPAEDALEDAAPPRSYRKRPGLRAKMVGIVLVFPLLVMAGAGFVFWDRRPPGGGGHRRADPRRSVSRRPARGAGFRPAAGGTGPGSGRCGRADQHRGLHDRGRNRIRRRTRHPGRCGGAHAGKPAPGAGADEPLT